ncbi:MAG: LysR family transcriptional regulator [Bradymonadia bacterium]
MFDDQFANALTMDQLKVFVTIVQMGSFSAAARALKRTQGSVSYHVGSLEAQLDLTLFDRTQRPAKLTPEGHTVFQAALKTLEAFHDLKQVAYTLSEGLESRVHLAVDALFPSENLGALLHRFQSRFPSVDLVVSSGVVEFALQQLLEGRADLAISPPLSISEGLVAHPCTRVVMVPVASPLHPLAQSSVPVTAAMLDAHVHLVVARAPDHGHSFALGHNSARRWFISDPQRRHALLLSGLGWARLPQHEARQRLASGDLVLLEADDTLPSRTVPLRVFHHADATMGPATQWLISALTEASEL